MQSGASNKAKYGKEFAFHYIYEQNHADPMKSEYLDESDHSSRIVDHVASSPTTDTASELDPDDPEWEEYKPTRVVRKSPKPSRRTSGRRKYGRKGAARGRHIIQHDYHDHSFDPVEFDDFVLVQDNSCSIKKKGGVAIPFPLKLHELLDKAEEEGLTHIVSWQPHGRAFVVHEPKLFVSQLMHRFFRQTKLTSFQRQLNLYGFCRLTKGRDGGGYYHELFLRGRPYLCKRMVRTKIKGTGYKAASNPDCEPDFYGMPPVGITYPNASPSPEVGKGKTLPIVTPQAGYEFGSGMYDRTQLIKGAPHLESLPQKKQQTCNKHVHKPYLSPRIDQKVVRMGNQSFQYMEPLHPVIGSDSTIQPQLKKIKTDGEDQSSVSISPSIFENSFSEETLNNENDEGVEECIDPLSVFLSEIGNDFEDDINFGSVNNLLDTNFSKV